MSDLAPPPQPPLLLTYSRLVRCFRQASKQGGRDNGEWRTTRSQINSILLFSRAPSHPSIHPSQPDWLFSRLNSRTTPAVQTVISCSRSLFHPLCRFQVPIQSESRSQSCNILDDWFLPLFSLLPSFFSWIRIALKRFIAVARWQARSQTPWYQHH